MNIQQGLQVRLSARTTKLIMRIIAGLLIFYSHNLRSQPSMVFASQMGGTFNDVGYSVTVDATGNTYVTGRFRGTTDFDPGPGVYNMTANAGSFSDIFVVKFDLNQNLIWAKQWGGAGDDYSYSIQLDQQGNIYTYGFFQYTVDFDPGAGTFNMSASLYDIFISKLDPSGNFIWAKQIAGFGQNMGMAMVMDKAGNIFIAGYTDGATDFDTGPGTMNLTPTGSWDVFVGKYDNSGNLIWAELMGGNGNDECYSIALDTSANIYITGWFTGTSDYDPGPSTFNLVSTGPTDVYITKLDSSGNFMWAKSMGGTGPAEGNCVIADDSGNVYFTGEFTGTCDFDPGPGTLNLNAVSAQDFFVGKLNSSGNLVWTNSFGGNNNDVGYSLALDTTGHVFVGGLQYSDSIDYDPSLVLNMQYSLGMQSYFIAKYDNTGALNCAFLIPRGVIGKDATSQQLIVRGQKVYITAGFNNNSDFNPCPPVYMLNPFGGADAFVACYDFTTCSCTMQYTTSFNAVQCNGDCSGSASVVVQGGSPPYSYSWSPSGGNSPTATGLCTGSYTCVVTDNSNATISTTFSITEPPVLAATGNSSNVTCNAMCNGTAQVNVSGGSPGYQYYWSTQQTTSSISSLCAGNYSVTVTDNNGCTVTQSVNITEPPAIAASISAIPTACSANNGSASVSASGGTGNLNYSWQPGGDTTASINNLTGGIYTVTITDQNGCSTVLSDTVVAIGAPVTGVMNINNVSCYGDSTGTATITASGNGPFSFQWSPYGGSSATASGLAAGTYTVMVTDTVGCTQSQTVSIVQPAAISASVISADDTCTSSSGSISISPSGGVGPYTYLWSSSQTSPLITGLTGGNYSVTITDNNGCTFDTSVSIISTVAPNASVASQTNVACNGDSTGSASVSASGGSAPYTYLWQPFGSNGPTATGLSSGTFTVIVSGTDGCSNTVTFSISEPPPISITCQSSDENCHNQDGYAFVVASGGAGGFNYSWNTSSSTDTIYQLGAGTYTVLITDQNGCSETCSVVVNTSATASANAGSDITIEQGQTTVLAGGGGISYNWQPSDLVDCSTCQITTTSPVETTTFVLTVTDSAGCTDYDTIVVFVEIPCDDIFIPNAFSPNGDGQNDILYVRGSCIKSFTLLVFNRWGEQVFQTSDLTVGWNGTWRGVDCEPAVFAFDLQGTKTDGSLFEEHGNVTLVK